MVGQAAIPGSLEPSRLQRLRHQTLSGAASTSTIKVQVDFPRAGAAKSEWLHNRIHRRNDAYRNAFIEFEQGSQSAANSPVCREYCDRESMFADHRAPSAATAQFDSQPWQLMDSDPRWA
jgi:hypothetical protein